jgi:oxygen-dependent protoporphyrinogen oxidase
MVILRKSSHVAIIGGGISGLSSAFYLKLLRPDIHVTIFDKESRWGGWIRTERLGETIFEAGPHSLRSSGKEGVTALELCCLLGLSPEIEFGDSLLSSRRFIYHEGRIEKIPTQTSEILLGSSPLSKIMRSGLKSIFNTIIYKTWPKVNDMSIYDYGSQVFGRPFTEILLDCIVGGIYGGNSKELSMRSCFPNLFRNEKGEGELNLKTWFSFSRSSLDDHLFPNHMKNKQEEWNILLKKSKEHKVWTLKQGLQSLIENLVTYLSNQSGVSLLSNTTASMISIHPELPNKVTIMDSYGKTKEVDQVISTVNSYELFNLLERSKFHLWNTYLPDFQPYCDIGVVLLCYNRKDVEHLMKLDYPYKGFGYLIPSKEQSVFLGVIFDSWIFPHQNANSDEFKITVMLRGSRIRDKSRSNLEKLALLGLEEQLHITSLPQKLISLYHENCIPQYLVDHDQKMMEMNRILLNSALGHKLIVSSSYFNNGIGVPSCIFRSKLLAKQLCLKSLDTMPIMGL